MAGKPDVPITLVVTQTLPLYIYEPMRTHDGSMIKYGLSVLRDLVPEDVRKHLFNRPGSPLKKEAWAGSRTKVEVVPLDVRNLIYKLQALDARNLPRNRVFEDYEVSAKITAVWTDGSQTMHKNFYALRLNKVILR